MKMEFRRHSKPKGQIAIENVILYAAVILAVLVILYLLWQSGLLMPLFGTKGWVGFSQIIPTDWVMAKNDESYLSIRNEGDAPARIGVESVDVVVGVVQCDPGPLDPQPPLILQPEDTIVVKIRCPGLDRAYEIGDYYEADIKVRYTNMVTGIEHMSVGKLYGRMEAVPSGWTPTTTTNPGAGENQTGCFFHECNKSGETDELNCGEIIFNEECTYCPKTPDLDGKRRCRCNGACGKACNVDKDCVYGERTCFNVCTTCEMGRCVEKEKNEGPGCGPCPPSDGGSFGSEWCNETICAYCFHEWVQRSEIPGDGFDSYTCQENGSCGNSCLYFGFDTYQDCEERCTYCEPDETTPDDTDGACDQGDCGRRCGPDAPTPECEKGCMWCNTTGDTPSYKCEMGDCDKPCTPDDELTVCQRGCDSCYDGRCVKADISVTLNAHNGTQGGKVVAEDGPIYLDVSGQCQSGVDKLLVSYGIPLPPEYSGYEDPAEGCSQIAELRNSQGKVRNPYGGADDPQSDEWLRTFNITWMDAHQCAGANPCLHTWTTSQRNVSVYCYFAAASKYSTAGKVEWSYIVSDYIQVGFLEVYLILPKPQEAEPAP